MHMTWAGHAMPSYLHVVFVSHWRGNVVTMQSFSEHRKVDKKQCEDWICARYPVTGGYVLDTV